MGSRKWIPFEDGNKEKQKDSWWKDEEEDETLSASYLPSSIKSLDHLVQKTDAPHSCASQDKTEL